MTNVTRIERKDMNGERRNRLFEGLLGADVANHKWKRQDLHFNFDGECREFMSALAAKVFEDASGSMKDFLAESPWPEFLADTQLSEAERAWCLVINAVKVWIGKETQYLDTLLTGGQFRKKLKKMAIGQACPVCRSALTEQTVELHHTVRDGRPPVPICRDCHKQLEGQTKTEVSEASGIGSQIKRLKGPRTSWSNLQKAVRAIQDLPHDSFRSENVANNSKSIVRRMMRETGLDPLELQRVIDSVAPA